MCGTMMTQILGTRIRLLPLQREQVRTDFLSRIPLYRHAATPLYRTWQVNYLQKKTTICRETGALPGMSRGRVNTQGVSR